MLSLVILFMENLVGLGSVIFTTLVYGSCIRGCHSHISHVELCSVTTVELKCLFAMVNRIKYTLVANIVDYFTNVSKISGPIKCTSLVTQIAMNLGYSDLAYIDGDVHVLDLDHFVHAHTLCEEPIILYPCCLVVRQFDYLTRAFDYTLMKVLHCSLIG
jgi:hypothetical protein